MTDTSEPDTSEQPEKTFGDVVKNEVWEWWKVLRVLVPIFLLFTGLVYEQRLIPSESMVPTLLVSDRVAVNKMAYGYGRHSLPFSMGRYLPLGKGRLVARTPERGDVVVFEHTHIPRVLIKRVIGLPGDQIMVLNDQIFLNGERIGSEFVRQLDFRRHDNNRLQKTLETRETIGENSWYAHNWINAGESNSAKFEVPEGHFFVMGDSRDFSLDSRNTLGHCPKDTDGVIRNAGCETPAGIAMENTPTGFVPLDHLVGRADTVLFSFNWCGDEEEDTCRKRIWRGL